VRCAASYKCLICYISKKYAEIFQSLMTWYKNSNNLLESSKSPYRYAKSLFERRSSLCTNFKHIVGYAIHQNTANKQITGETTLHIFFHKTTATQSTFRWKLLHKIHKKDANILWHKNNCWKISATGKTISHRQQPIYKHVAKYISPPNLSNLNKTHLTWS